MRSMDLLHVMPWWSSWSESLWRASWQGALCALAVWVLAKAVPRLPASLRAGLWWLVALKFVLTLGWPHPVSLALLPAETVAAVNPAQSQMPALSSPGEGSQSKTSGVALPLREGSPAVAGPSASAAEGSVARAPGLAASDTGNSAHTRDLMSSHAGTSGHAPGLAVPGHGSSPEARFVSFVATSSWWLRSLSGSSTVAWTLLLLWGAGVLWQVRGHVRAWRQVQGMRERARPLKHPVLEEETEFLASEAGLRRPPLLLVSDEVMSPLAAGLVSPAIVLPSKAVREFPEDALRMALAHEVAHLRRGDLWLGWVPALAETVLFFHPLARRAAREYALAREEACDAEALRLTGAEPADYGELLIAFGITRPPGSAAALGASAHLHALHRRLRMLEHVDVVPTHPRRWLKGALFALGALVLMPFQVVAKAPAESPSTAPGKSTEPGLKVGTVRSLSDESTPDTGTATAQKSTGTPSSADKAATSPKAPVPPASPARAMAPPPPVPPASPARVPVAPTPPVPPVPAARVAMAPPPAPPAPPTSVGAQPALPALPRLAAAPVPPAPPRPPSPPDMDDGDTFAYLSDGRTMISGSSDDVHLARTFKQKGKDIIFVRRADKPFLIRDPQTLEQVRKLMEDAGKLGDAQGALGQQQAALGQKQAALGQKQAELAYPQTQLASKHAALALKHADIGMERARIAAARRNDSDRDDAERDRQEEALDKREADLDREREAIDKQQEELSGKMEAVGQEQAKLGEQQAKLGEQQAKLAEEQAGRHHEQFKKVMNVVDEAIRKGLAEPLPT
ncbi:biotin transporter BioY [Corallococcus sp. bb12-1]|uniref:M56 family metallopeptidase n=1 Tax=Corallococcus sp. bb12-1 TaxID=2996784 RepID=UPI00226F3DDB|nr:M56 family metallopeptidase [Corallococcus sp. bb12-1]MCY1040180.1 biotin transporter BioY [Corallococcus sp. bb12-1]